MDIIGKKFNRLTITNTSDIRTKDKSIQVLCKCDCGREVLARKSHVLSGTKKSCGCMALDYVKMGRNKGNRKLFQKRREAVSHTLIDQDFDN